MTLILTLSLLSQVAPDSPASVAQAFALMNAARARHGLPAYRPSLALGRAARVHSLDQARHGRMSHRGSDGSQSQQRAARQGYRGQAFGENVGWNQQSADAIVSGWMRSPGHRAAILSRNYSDCGIACEMGSRGPYWTSVFGSP